MNRLKLMAVLWSTTLGAGCAGAAGPLTAPQSVSSSVVNSSLAKDDLVYVTNRNAEVTVYNLATEALVGVLTRFTQPMGECVDASGNIYIADESAQKVVEYAHGGKKPIQTFDDAPDSPYTCSVDANSGNLAVANNGDIAIWAKGSNTPVRYTDSAFQDFTGCAYDGNGNLLTTDGGDPSKFAWLPRGGAKLIDIVLPGPKSNWTWYFIAGIQWDGQFFVLDFESTAYRVAVLHGLAYYIGDTQISDYEAYGPFWIFRPPSKSQGIQILGHADGRSGYSSRVESFDYPSGTGPILEIMHGLDSPFAIAVSPKT